MVLTAKFDGGFYDCDGTLVDSGPHNIKLMKGGLRAQNQERPEKVILEARAFPWDQCVRHLFPDASAEVIDQYNGDVTTMHYQLIDELEVFPHVLEALQSHRQQGIPLAIVSNREYSIYWMLKKKGLYDSFDAFVDVSMINEPKPSPQSTLLAARFLGVDPRRCFGVGDSKTDIYAYKAAGVGLTIGFAPGYDGYGLAEANPDYIVHSYKTIEHIISHGIRGMGDKPIIWQDF